MGRKISQKIVVMGKKMEKIIKIEEESIDLLYGINSMLQKAELMSDN
jgi:hypothetical protein